MMAYGNNEKQSISLVICQWVTKKYKNQTLKMNWKILEKQTDGKNKEIFLSNVRNRKKVSSYTPNK